MRMRFIFAVSFFLLAAVSSPAVTQEWTLVESGVLDDLYDIFFVDYETGWAVGADSTIIKTTDRGHTWYRQTGGVAEDYRCVFFRNANLGWIGGTGGLVLHTTNGGDTWVRQETEDVMTVNDIDFVDDNNGWIAADNGTYGQRYLGVILRTTNGGNNWDSMLRTPLYLSYDSTSYDSLYFGKFHSVDFIDEKNGCVTSEIINDRRPLGSILVTSDGGATWKDISTWNTCIATTSVHMANLDTIYAGTLDGLTYTTNRGVGHFNWLNPIATCLDLSVVNNNVYTLADRDSGVRIVHYNVSTTTYTFQWLEGEKFHYNHTKGFPTMGLWLTGVDTGWVCGDSGRLWRKPSFVNPVENPALTSAAEFRIEAVYPNPTHSSVTIEYFLDVRQNVRIAVYSLLGTEVAVLEDGLRGQGSHRVEFSAPAHLPSGLYFYELQTPQGTARGSMLLAK